MQLFPRTTSIIDEMWEFISHVRKAKFSFKLLYLRRNSNTDITHARSEVSIICIFLQVKNLNVIKSY